MWMIEWIEKAVLWRDHTANVQKKTGKLTCGGSWN